MNIKLIYTTLPNKEIARDIAQKLVSEKLAACTNILGEIESCYIWEGQLEASNEVALIAKTAMEEKLIKRLKELHPYQLPCIISLDINGGLPDFLNWIKTQTQDN